MKNKKAQDIVDIQTLFLMLIEREAYQLLVKRHGPPDWVIDGLKEQKKESGEKTMKKKIEKLPELGSCVTGDDYHLRMEVHPTKTELIDKINEIIDVVNGEK